jgi:hypothetical protein
LRQVRCCKNSNCPNCRSDKLVNQFIDEENLDSAKISKSETNKNIVSQHPTKIFKIGANGLTEVTK